MVERFEIELEPEVRLWLMNLARAEYDRVEFYADLLADQAEVLGEPYSRHLGGGVRELRFHLPQRQVRITYWLAPGRRAILLTVFRKARERESAEVARALKAQRECAASHGHAVAIYDRGKEE